MPLAPPPDHTKSVQIIAAGIAVGLFVYSLTSFKGPQVGDHSHSLPFGGVYKDGTKFVQYNGQKASKSSLTSPSPYFPIALILVLGFLIYVSERVHSTFHNRSGSTCVCTVHRAANGN